MINSESRQNDIYYHFNPQDMSIESFKGKELPHLLGDAGVLCPSFIMPFRFLMASIPPGGI